MFLNSLLKIKYCATVIIAGMLYLPVKAQIKDAVVNNIVKEANENSHLENLAHELLDRIGPRLVGTPQMMQAHNWAVSKYNEWDIKTYNEKWGEWKGWERGISHVDMISPRLRTLEATQLAWSPNMKKAITAEVVVLGDVSNAAAFNNWLPNVKGKFVLISMIQPTGRPDYNWKEYATPESFEKMKSSRSIKTDEWAKRIAKTGHTAKELPLVLEKAGAAGIISNYWAEGFGVDRIFGAVTKNIPTINVALEDYGLLYRLAESGSKPTIRVKTEAKDLGVVPTFNTLAEIKGVEKPDEYVILSAHFDSWDGASGATDNGTGTITMMEAIRILKKVYPNPKRTILVGLWGSEEQGLNGSKAFVEDHPEVVKNIQAVFNQDNGTGRVTNISGQGFLNAYDYINRWLSKVPDSIKRHVQTTFPGTPGRGGSDFASFVAAGVPAFSLSSLSWSYGSYTWHTNRDTYDKIVFDDVRNNVILTAIMAYMASEDPVKASREKMIMPADPTTGQQFRWPSQVKPNRRGGLN